jgi:hypothetical protein
MDVKKYACTAFKKITRADLVAGYVGQTALKTRNIVNECLGGVIFSDEAYSLGNDTGGDTFSKECVDTLCELLSDQKDHLMFIIAGYENEIDELESIPPHKKTSNGYLKDGFVIEDDSEDTPKCKRVTRGRGGGPRRC